MGTFQTISLDKQYQTRGGNPVKILSLTDGLPEFPVIGVINPGTTEFEIAAWTTAGCFLAIHSCPKDLVEVPPSCIPYRRYLLSTLDGDAYIRIVSYMDENNAARITGQVESSPNFIRWIDPEPITHPIQE